MSHLQNDKGVEEITIQKKSFICIGESPPHDHPHVSLMIPEDRKWITCPYCRTRYVYSP